MSHAEFAPPSSPSSVRLLGLRKSFGDAWAINGLDLDISPGEFIVLLGPSGCGKSTLLRLVAGLERPTAGEIWIGERDVTELTPKDRDVAMVFQNYALYEHMTVRDNLAFGLMVRGLGRHEIQSRVLEFAKSLDLGAVLSRKPSQLSGGQRQRVAIGRAMVRQPQLFLMDEPLSSLDAQLRDAMRGELARLRQRLSTTTLYVTHDQAEATTLGDRIAILREGVIEQCDTPQNTFRNPANLFVASFIGAPAMNFFQAVVSDHSVRLGEAVVPVAAPRLEGRSVVVGIRPDGFTGGSAAAPDLPRLDVTCEVVEELGSESYVILQLPVDAVDPAGAAHVASSSRDTQLLAPDPDKATFIARTLLTPETRPGQTVRLAVDPAALYFFDPVTGAALPRGRVDIAVVVASGDEVEPEGPDAGVEMALCVPERLGTERLILRRWGQGDRHSMVALWRDPGVWRALQPGLAFDPHRGEREFQRQLDHWREHGFGLWAVVDRESLQTIGWIGPTHPFFIPELAREVEVGWTLRREFWGRGLASEAAQAVFAAIFTHAPWPYVISIIHPDNSRSAGVAQRAGMSLDREALDPSLGQQVGVWKLGRGQWSARHAALDAALEPTARSTTPPDAPGDPVSRGC